MTHRERYDPEDIEVLLSERSFEELLPEERAYVLRHLSGREEYEAMRATLQQIREQDLRRKPIKPDAQVRHAVMAAYRLRSGTGWRYHLNTVGAWLFPPDARAMLRPALVLGGLALLVVTTVWLAGPGMEHGGAELAEVQQQKEEASPPATPHSSAADEVEIQTATHEDADTGTTTMLAEVKDQREPATARMHEYRSTTQEDMQPSAPMLSDVVMEETDAEVVMERAAEQTRAASAKVEGYAVAEPTLDSREVRMDELSMNMTTADGSVQRSAKQIKASSMSRALNVDADLLDLLTAAW